MASLTLLNGPGVATQAILGYLEFLDPGKKLTPTQRAIQQVVYQVLESIPRPIHKGEVRGIIFWDVDGVVVPYSKSEESFKKAKGVWGEHPLSVEFYELNWTFAITDFAPEAVANLQSILDSRENTGIVLTSNRRNNVSVASIQKITEKTFGKYIVDKTQDVISPPLSRGEEITIWKDAHPSVRNYVILDDQDQYISEDRYTFLPTPLAAHFVQVNSEYLTSADAEKAIQILKTPSVM